MTKSRGILPPRRAWTQAELGQLRVLYPDNTAAEVARQLACEVQRVYSMAQRLGLKKSTAFQASAASGRLDGVKGEATRFRPGAVPWSAGKKGLDMGGRSHATRFTKGITPHNHLPVGTELVKSIGYLYVKVAEPNKWVAKHQLVWTAENGPVPSGHVLAFRDRNRMNCAIGNLELITRSELQARNSIHNKSPELGRLVQLKGQITRQVNRIVREHEESKKA